MTHDLGNTYHEYKITASQQKLDLNSTYKK